ncbi:4-phosphopantetheinyl transferase [Sphaerisporangium album]|uniref:4-phosphopantetheinyl transferase n=1 Tax=Sphaerisporangium album TaxID=509200 RepID=A0A367FKW4_9ACTN|nr:4'-phosphopantetheinyl transferase superfamily protein [Sphaerisporangium album]RCG30285.1 4-phosphopantetheinyl transferase [Sphaerisporangium album]
MSGLAAPARDVLPAATAEAGVWLLAESQVEPLAAAAPPEEVLSDDERDRVARLRGPGARRRGLGARLLARLLLARYAGVRPSVLSFATRWHGRPELSPNPWRLRFNLSHSEGLIACVVTSEVPCGVDVQRPVGQDVLHHLAMALSEPEAARLSVLRPGPPQARVLVDTWTVKEAYTKALGVGLRYGFEHLTVEGLPDGPVSLHDARVRHAEDRPWRFRLDHLPTGHSLAVAVRRPGPAPYPIVVRQFMDSPHISLEGVAL